VSASVLSSQVRAAADGSRRSTDRDMNEAYLLWTERAIRLVISVHPRAGVQQRSVVVS
jgi:hypothetical protein